MDTQRRVKLWKNDKKYQDDVATMQEIIYEKGYAVNSKVVDWVMGLQSLTPTHVSPPILHMHYH